MTDQWLPQGGRLQKDTRRLLGAVVPKIHRIVPLELVTFIIDKLYHDKVAK